MKQIATQSRLTVRNGKKKPRARNQVGDQERLKVPYDTKLVLNEDE